MSPLGPGLPTWALQESRQLIWGTPGDADAGDRQPMARGSRLLLCSKAGRYRGYISRDGSLLSEAALDSKATLLSDAFFERQAIDACFICGGAAPIRSVFRRGEFTAQDSSHLYQGKAQKIASTPP